VKKGEMMKILVTGSAGLIGQALVALLRQEGYEVRTLDRYAQKQEAAGEHVPGDLRDIHLVRRAVQGMDAVAHLGAIPSDSHGREDEVLSVNVQGTWNVLLACVEAGVSRAVCYSSVNALGCFGGHRPAVYLPIDDSYPRHPITVYQLSKHLVEETCQAFTARYGLQTICLRPVGVWNKHALEKFRREEFGRQVEWGKEQYWSYVALQDVCDATLRALTVENVTYDAFLLSASDTFTPIPTAELVEKFYPNTPWLKQDLEAYLATNPYRSLIDCSHAREVLGWEPKHSWRNADGDGGKWPVS